MPSLLDPLRSIPLAVLDVETTGAAVAYGDRVTELGIVRVEGGRVVAAYSQLFNPQRRIPYGVSLITGITDDMVIDQPLFADCREDFTALLRGTVLVGHNVGFDLSFLAGEFQRAGTTIAAAVSPIAVLDTVRIARKLYGRGGNGLQILSRKLGVAPAIAHRALADSQTTASILEIMLRSLRGWDTTLVDVLSFQGGTISLEPTAKQNPLPLDLADALTERCPVRIEYLDATNSRTERIIQPLEVRRNKGELTLVAHCQLRNERRTFKLNRIVKIEPMLDYQPWALPGSDGSAEEQNENCYNHDVEKDGS